MAEAFLEEQLKRIREMSEQMTRVRDRAAEVCKEVARQRESCRQGPLQEVRDFRTFSSYPEQERDRADDHGARGRRRSHETTRRRR